MSLTRCDYCKENITGRNDIVWHRWNDKEGFVHNYCALKWEKKMILDELTSMPNPCPLCGRSEHDY